MFGLFKKKEKKPDVSEDLEDDSSHFGSDPNNYGHGSSSDSQQQDFYGSEPDPSTSASQFGKDFSSDSTSDKQFEFSSDFDNETEFEDKSDTTQMLQTDPPAALDVKAKRKMPFQYSTCGIIGVGNFLKGAQLGGGFGLVMGIYEGGQTWMSGIRQPAMIFQHVLGRGIGNAFTFGTYLGVYSGTKCSLIVARGGKQDLFNVGAAGGLAGLVGTIRTGSPSTMAGSAFMGAGLMLVMEGMQS